jgi:hypothetical protein
VFFRWHTTYWRTTQRVLAAAMCILVLSSIAGGTLANASTADSLMSLTDDFNDNVRNSNLWKVGFIERSGANPDVAVNETNGQL